MKSKAILILSITALVILVVLTSIYLFGWIKDLNQPNYLTDTYKEYGFIFKPRDSYNYYNEETKKPIIQSQNIFVSQRYILQILHKNRMLIMIKYLGLLSNLIIGILITLQLLVLGRALNKKELYTETIIKAIKNIGSIMIYGCIAQIIIALFLGNYLNNYLSQLLRIEKALVEVSYTKFQPINIYYSNASILLGLTFRAIAYLLKNAKSMKEELDLTV